MEAFKRVYRVGTVDGRRGRCSYYVCAEFDGRKLSLQGVEGPLASGDCLGSCGQARDGLTRDDFEPGEGWTRESAARLSDIWERWHLNDMNASDAAMRRDGWEEEASQEALCFEFTLSDESIAAKKAAESAAMEALREGFAFEPTAAQSAAAVMPYSVKIWRLASEAAPQVPDGYRAARDILGRGGSFDKPPERKTLGWIRPNEFDRGLLGKIHPESGNAYGGTWYFEEVPESVLEELRNFPVYSAPLRWFDWAGA